MKAAWRMHEADLKCAERKQFGVGSYVGRDVYSASVSTAH